MHNSPGYYTRVNSSSIAHKTYTYPLIQYRRLFRHYCFYCYYSYSYYYYYSYYYCYRYCCCRSTNRASIGPILQQRGYYIPQNWRYKGKEEKEEKVLNRGASQTYILIQCLRLAAPIFKSGLPLLIYYRLTRSRYIQAPIGARPMRTLLILPP